MAMVNLMEAGERFKHGDPLFENVIWECEMMRMNLEDEHTKLSERYRDIQAQIYHETDVHDDEQAQIFNMISTQLFDVFTYESIEDHNEVMWLEYFHEVYDLIMDEHQVFYKNLKTSIILFNSVDPPDYDPPTQRTRYIFSLFNTYIAHQEALSQTHGVEAVSRQRIERRTSLGKELVEIKNAIRPIAAKLEVYNRIAAWSLR
jgi:hypothetical protein